MPIGQSLKRNAAGKQLKGFAVMSPERVRQIATLGGRASRGGGRKPKAKGERDGTA